MLRYPPLLCKTNGLVDICLSLNLDDGRGAVRLLVRIGVVDSVVDAGKSKLITLPCVGDVMEALRTIKR